jgi:hypothetical protein
VDKLEPDGRRKRTLWTRSKLLGDEQDEARAQELSRRVSARASLILDADVAPHDGEER